ncbi:MAG: copper homeostasis protein [Pirellulaceae bacterium]|jgi:copper homeostasis protein
MILEICIDRIESAFAALAGGANRLEVCCALAVGGLTPSAGLLAECCDFAGITVMAMIRPRAGDFCYAPKEVDVMVRDIVAARDAGVDGVVIGALTSAGKVDRHVCQQLLDAAGTLDVTFHRAFDLAVDPFEALDDIINLGIKRLLTSGQQVTALDGIDLIRRLVLRSGDSLAIMAGAGVDASNVEQLLEVGLREIHGSCSVSERRSGSASAVAFGETLRVTCANNVRDIRSAMARNADS